MRVGILTLARDLAPLGAVSKVDAKAFLRWAQERWDLPIINEFVEATPTAELLPLSAGVQADESENEMGLTYEELSKFGILRSVDRLGPWSCYLRLLAEWKERPGFGPKEIAARVLRVWLIVESVPLLTKLMPLLVLQLLRHQ